MKLLHHLVMHVHDYDVDREYDEIEKIERELYRDIQIEAIDRLCDELQLVEAGSEKEKEIISEMMELYIPEFVTKHPATSTATSSGSSKDQKKEEDPALTAVESIDHPMSPPLKRESTKEYLEEKKQAIEKMIGDNKQLKPRQQKEMVEMLQRYLDRFSLAGENMERTDTVTHEIDTGNNKPFRERLRTYSPAVQEVIDNEVRRMLREGVIQHSRSPYASNLLLVRKPDPSSPGGVKNRVCASFVQLNTQTVKDSYPLPNIQVMFDKIGRSKWFTTMDLLNGFWQVMVKEEHRHKTAFITARGLFEFVVMPFGLCNAPATFQRLMDTVIKPEYRGFIETYIDDVMTHSKTFEQHLVHVETLLQLLHEHKLVVKLTKCKFAQREVKFLGHILSQGKLRPNPESVAAIVKWERPTQGVNKQKALRGFLGMVGWYRKFIPKFAEIARPLFALLMKEAKWEWTPACQAAFEQLRDAITNKPVLIIADPNKDYILDTDASGFALGAMLMQNDDEGHPHPIAYASKTLGPAERNYSPTDREALAIVWALEHFNTYCEGHKYTAITDHAALRYMLNNKEKTPRMHRMVAKLSPYEIKLAYRPGSQNHAADLLSRQEEYMQTKSVEANGMSLRSSIKRYDENKNEDTQKRSDDGVEKKNDQSKRKRVTFSKRRRRPRLTDDAFEVERIVNKRPLAGGKPNEYEYEVKWKNYSSSQNTWQTLDTLRDAVEAVVDFEAERQAEELGDEVYETENDVCGECGEKCAGPTALIVHAFHQHKRSPPAPEHLEIAAVSTETLRSLQQTDVTLQFIYNHLNGVNNNNLTNLEVKALMTHVFLTDEDGVLYCIDDSTTKKKTNVRTAMKVVIPSTLRQQVMQAMHTGSLVAHPGIVRMIDKMKHYMWWIGMYADVVQYVTTCITCQKVKTVPRSVPPQAVKLATRPWQILAIDAVGPLPTTKQGNKYIIDIVCCFTRYVEGWAVPEIDMVSVSRKLIEKVVCRYGLFEVLVSDRGSIFVGTLTAHVLRALKIKKVQTTAQHAQANGVIERFHETLKITLKIWSHETKDEWDELLCFALFAYNTAYHTILQEVPHYLNHGFDARLPVHEILGTRNQPDPDVHLYAADMVDRLRTTYTRVTDILTEINKERSTEEYMARIIKFKIGDNVWVYDYATKKDENAKLKTRWTGPFKIIERKSEVVYVIDRNGKPDAVNVVRMKTAMIEEKDAVPESEDEQKQYQLEKIEKEMEHLQRLQEEILTRQRQKQSQADDMRRAAHIARQIIDNDKAHDDNEQSVNDGVDDNVVEAMVMEMYSYAHDLTLWTR